MLLKLISERYLYLYYFLLYANTSNPRDFQQPQHPKPRPTQYRRQPHQNNALNPQRKKESSSQAKRQIFFKRIAGGVKIFIDFLIKRVL